MASSSSLSPSPWFQASLLHTNACNPNPNPNPNSSSRHICLLARTRTRTRTRTRRRRMNVPWLNIFDGLSSMKSRASPSSSSSSPSSSSPLFSQSSKKMDMIARASIDLHPIPSRSFPNLPRRRRTTTADTDLASCCNASDWIQHALNISSKWMVMAAVAGVVLWRHDEQAYWAVIGGVVNGVASKLLKRAFNEQRPLTALGLKHDPGMPSTHAQSFAFFSLYASLSLMSWQGIIRLLPISVSVLLFGFYLAWLRVSQGLHTREQVIAGTFFGYGMAALWIGLWNHAAGNAAFHYALKSLYLLSLLYFTIYALKNWRFGEP